MTDQVFGGPYYYYKRDPKHEDRFTEVITLAIMTNARMDRYSIS